MFAFEATASTAQAEQLSSEHLYQPGDQVPTKQGAGHSQCHKTLILLASACSEYC